jgi:hypothetical protein
MLQPHHVHQESPLQLRRPRLHSASLHVSRAQQRLPPQNQSTALRHRQQRECYARPHACLPAAPPCVATPRRRPAAAQQLVEAGRQRGQQLGRVLASARRHLPFRHPLQGTSCDMLPAAVVAMDPAPRWVPHAAAAAAATPATEATSGVAAAALAVPGIIAALLIHPDCRDASVASQGPGALCGGMHVMSNGTAAALLATAGGPSWRLQPTSARS